MNDTWYDPEIKDKQSKYGRFLTIFFAIMSREPRMCQVALVGCLSGQRCASRGTYVFMQQIIYCNVPEPLGGAGCKVSVWPH